MTNPLSKKWRAEIVYLSKLFEGNGPQPVPAHVRSIVLNELAGEVDTFFRWRPMSEEPEEGVDRIAVDGGGPNLEEYWREGDKWTDGYSLDDWSQIEERNLKGQWHPISAESDVK